jgi:hypothetical protein
MLGRERAFREQADKIEKLRQKRISTQSFVFEVVRHRGHWCILHGNKYSKPFDGQAEAIDEAQQAARTKAAQGYPVEVIVRQAD